MNFTPTRTFALTLALLTDLAVVSPVRASRLVVPDDVATIQAALDLRVDTVLVRNGGRPESPIVRFPVTLIAFPRDHGNASPVLAGLTVETSEASAVPLRIGGLHFTGPVNVFDGNGPIDELDLVDCQLESGISDVCDCDNGGTRRLTLRRCRISGEAVLDQRGENVVDSCVVTGSILAGQDDTRLTVTNSEFHGNGVNGGIGTFGEIHDATVTGNSFDGYAAAIGLQSEHSLEVSGNRIRDCAYTAIGLGGPVGDVQVVGNHIERCGAGIYVDAEEAIIAGNSVSHAADWGIVAIIEGGASVRSNVVWGSGRDGFRIDGECDGPWEVTNNTSIGNGGSGFESNCQLYADGRYEFTRNIGDANGGYGVHWTKPDVSLAGCNDWFANALGDVLGRSPSPGDFALDPFFCDAASGDFHLAASSPVADRSGCGLIGALGVGCTGAPAAPIVDGAHPGAAFRLTLAGPSPAPGMARIEFELEHAAPIELDVFDLQGRLVASPARGVWPAGQHTLDWPGPGSTAAAGVYLVRYRYPGGEFRRRIVYTP